MCQFARDEWVLRVRDALLHRGAPTESIAGWHRHVAFCVLGSHHRPGHGLCERSHTSPVRSPTPYSQKTRAETDWANVLVKVLTSESVFYENTGPDAAGKPKGRGASCQNEAFLLSGQPTVGWCVGQVVEFTAKRTLCRFTIIELKQSTQALGFGDGTRVAPEAFIREGDDII